MKQRGCSEEEAYVLLRRTAMNQNRKIAELARALVAAAELLQPGGSND
jgi:response regulator NasT